MLFSFSTFAEKKIYFMGVDGMSHDAFVQAQKQGMFKEFPNLAAHISPFPSMTDISWSNMMKTTQLFGAPGRIRNVEAVFLNPSTKTVEGDVRDYYNRLAQPKYYLNGFQHMLNPYVEALVYFPTKDLARYEIQTVLAGFSSSRDAVTTGYVGSVDSTAHTQPDRLYPVMRDLDAELKKFIAERKAAGEDFEIVLVSDHGNKGRFEEGTGKESELLPIEIEPSIKAAGLSYVSKLEKDNDVAMPLLALGTWAPVYFQNRANAPKLVSELVKNSWFDLAFSLVENSATRVDLLAVSSTGAAHLIYDKASKNYYYYASTGNPLQMPADTFSVSPGKQVALTEERIEKATRSGAYPDSIIRLIEAANSASFDFPDLILTFKDGYYLNNALGKHTKMYRTHGSLSRASTLGVVASTGRTLPAYIRTENILAQFGIKPELLFAKNLNVERRSAADAIKSAQASAEGIATGARLFSQKRIFQLINRLVADSRPFFIVDEIQSFLSALGLNGTTVATGQAAPTFNFDFSKLQSKEIITQDDLGKLTDLALRAKSVEDITGDASVTDIKNRIGLTDASAGSPQDQRAKVLAAKRSAMKLYQLPALLEQSIVVPERPYLKDTRDLAFAQYWDSYRKSLVNSPAALTNTTQKSWIPFASGTEVPSNAQRLFSTAFAEEKLQDLIAPTPLDRVLKRNLDNVTVVYVPGTYNGIFDREIFSLALLSLQEELGLRTLKAPVMSACASDVNAAALLKFLKEDSARFAERKQQVPRYLLLGYSKGAIDSLYALLQDKQFARNQIVGLAAIAAPLKGSQVLEKSDLPFQVVNLLIEEETPQICQSTKTATSSVSTQAMAQFWRKNEHELIGLTRYFSVSFVSEPEDSHLFMKATKIIAQFDEENDGVVALSASKFPATLMPVDLGQVKGDHLAGILASRFPQKAFFKSLVKTFAELGLSENAVNKTWNETALAAAPAFVADPAADYMPKVRLSNNQLGYDPYQSLDLRALPDTLSAKRVQPSTTQNFPQGIDLSFNHDNTIFYRMDHQFLYESRSPVGGDNNAQWGFQSVKGPDNTPWLALRSVNNSVRLTTLSYRFRPSEFKNMKLALQVNKGPQGADSKKDGSGKDDSAFQVWFTLRDTAGLEDRSIGDKNNSKVYLFGYYWAEETNGKIPAGTMLENYYSKANYTVVTLPPAYQVALNNGNDKLGQPVNYDRDLRGDLQNMLGAMKEPVNVDNLEVIAITIQMDSNDTGTASEALMKTLKFVP